MRTPTELPNSTWPKAAADYQRATLVMPGGNTRTQLYVAPHPLYVKHGKGSRITLVDGRELDDFLTNYTAAACGYGHPELIAAATEALACGVPFGMPTEWEIGLAEALVDRVEAVERIRFTNSGSEATLHAIRTARAHSGRFMIAKAEGAYHGSHDLADFSVAKMGDRPLEVVPETKCIPQGIADLVVLLPFNDLQGTVAVLDRHRDALATVLLEPFLNSAGCIPADPEYFRGVAAWCAENDVLFTVDEVASFRASYGGVHSDFGVRPDLLCLGKSIGGGFAVGAFGGRADVMAVLDPREGGHIKHAGTFNGHPATMAAGKKALELLDRDAIDRMNRQGERLIEGIRAIGADHDVELTATGYGSIGNLHFSRVPPRNAREANALSQARRLDFFWALIERGYVVAPRLQFSTSLATEDAQVEGLLEAIDDAVEGVFAKGLA